MIRLQAQVQARQIQRAFQRSPAVMRRHVGRALGRAALELARDAARLAPVAYGDVRRSIRPTRLGPLDYRVGPSVQHAAHAELGTGPRGVSRGTHGGTPSIPAILNWIGVKRIQPRTAGYSMRDLAWAIRHSIREHGTYPRPYMAPSAERMSARIQARIAVGIAAGLREAGL